MYVKIYLNIKYQLMVYIGITKILYYIKKRIQSINVEKE